MTIKNFLKDFDNVYSNITVYTPESTGIYKYVSDVIETYGKRNVTCWDVSVTTEGQPQIEIWS